MPPRLSPALRSVLTAIDGALRARFGDRLRFVRLFGSWARLEATDASDIDVAIVIDRLSPAERGDVLDIVGDAEERSELVLSTFLMSGERFDALVGSRGGIARAILDEGIGP